MIGEEVLLSVPSVETMRPDDAARLIRERETEMLVAVEQKFEGAFSGRALLIFPEAASLDLVRAVIGQDMTAEEAAEMEHEALAETGNIILNGCLATMVNMMRRSLNISLPSVIRGDGAQLFNPPQGQSSDGLVLFLYINFSVRNRDIRGYIAMLLDLPSLETLKQLIAEFIERVIGTEGEVASGQPDASRP
jgi:chemotaxis protein CheC